MTNLLLRQIHPDHLPDGRGVSSAAFRPTPKDEGKLSVDCGNMTSPQAAHDLHLKKGFKTSGTWGITREECASEQLNVLPDPISKSVDGIGNPAHHVVVFPSEKRKSNRNIAKRLRDKAVDRGRLWPLDR